MTCPWAWPVRRTLTVTTTAMAASAARNESSTLSFIGTRTMSDLTQGGTGIEVKRPFHEQLAEGSAAPLTSLIAAGARNAQAGAGLLNHSGHSPLRRSLLQLDLGGGAARPRPAATRDRDHPGTRLARRPPGGRVVGGGGAGDRRGRGQAAVTPHPEMERALGLLEAVAAGPEGAAKETGRLLGRLLSAFRAARGEDCFVPALLAVVLRSLAQAQVVPQGSHI